MVCHYNEQQNSYGLISVGCEQPNFLLAWATSYSFYTIMFDFIENVKPVELMHLQPPWHHAAVINKSC